MAALGFLIWINAARIKRVEYVDGLAGWSSSDPGVSLGHKRWPSLVVPEHDNVSYEWLDQTRQMFALRQWRVRHVDYENVPYGHEVRATSPYRWWLGLVAWAGYVSSGQRMDEAVEWAALRADPFLYLLLLIGTVIFVARQFGILPAALLAVGMAIIFPLAGDFVPGAPNDHGLAQAAALWAVLPLLAGLRALNSAALDAERRARLWFLWAGVIGALGLWISASTLVPMLCGVILGGLMAACTSRYLGDGAVGWATRTVPWGSWALGGAAASLFACLIEYFPSHLASWELRVIHPLYGLAWLGAGEVLAQAVGWIGREKPGRRPRNAVLCVLAVVAIAAVPFTLWRTHSLGFLEVDLPALRLVRLPSSPVASDALAWLKKDGITATAAATLLPLVLLFPALWVLLRRQTDAGGRAAVAVCLGPVLVALGFACRQLSWWSGLDAVLLALLVAATVALGRSVAQPAGRWGWSALVVLLLLPGIFQLTPPKEALKQNALNQTEVVGMIERDLAHWLALHAGPAGAVVLAPPNETATMYYYAGVRGIATLSWENRDGLGAGIRIASASTPEEAQDLISGRGVTHIVIPQWDPYLDIYARMGLGQLEGSFMNRLHVWDLPPWLRPMSYVLPTIGGFEGQSVTVFEVVEDQEDAAAKSRLAEYFVEMDHLDLAAAAAQALRRFPADLGALVARAQVEKAMGDSDAFAHTMDLVLPQVTAGASRSLPWDRRVSLAIVLALGQHTDLARAQVRQCLSDIDEEKLRSLSTGSLYRLEVLSKSVGEEIADPHLHLLALDLLPQFLRSRVEP